MMTLRFVLSSITEEAVGDSPLTNMAFSLSYISLLKYEFVYIFLLNDIEVGFHVEFNNCSSLFEKCSTQLLTIILPSKFYLLYTK